MKMSNYMSSLVIALAVTIMAGCAVQPKLTQDQVMSQYPQVQTLDSALKEARSKDAELLAPQGYEKMNQSLATAIAAAQSGDTKNAQKAADEGLNLLNTLNLNTENSRDIMADVLQVRDRAYTAGAATLQKQKITELDNDLKNAAALIEKGNIEKAKQLRPKLLASYKQLELNTLKQGNLELAKSAVANAKQQGAEELAPATFALAQEQMRLADTILDADRTQTAKAEIHAKNAKWLAEQSSSITEAVKDFKRRDYSIEDIILWHQQQLEVVNEPLGIQIPFNLSSDKAALSLRNAIAAEQDKAALNLRNAIAAEQEVSKELAMTAEGRQDERKERQDELKKDSENKKKFDMVQAIFTADEAKVYRQGENVLISAHGFDFPSGQSEIQTKNFPLMNKIIQAIKVFPNARIGVVGHTDSTGNEAVNQMLSNARAEKVAKFLVEIGQIKQDNITSVGFGENRPVATNETAAGRAENRRVEIHIENQ